VKLLVIKIWHRHLKDLLNSIISYVYFKVWGGWRNWRQLVAFVNHLQVTNDKLLQVAMAVGLFDPGASYLVAITQPEVLDRLVGSCINTRLQEFGQVIINERVCQVHGFSVVDHHVVLEDNVSRELLRASASTVSKCCESRLRVCL